MLARVVRLVHYMVIDTLFKHPDSRKLRDAKFVWVKINFSGNENAAFLSAYPEISVSAFVLWSEKGNYSSTGHVRY
jgi:hypothetical protein